jgi:uncharacterized protein YraI
MLGLTRWGACTCSYSKGTLMTQKLSYTRVRTRFAAVALTVALSATGAFVTTQAASAAPSAVAAAAAAPSRVVPAAAKKVMVTTADLNLRTSPSTSAKIITVLKKGTKVTVTASSGSWRKVAVGSRTGWVSAKFLKAVVVKAAAKVTVTSRTKSSVDLGAKLTFAGKTSKNLKGKTVALQIRAGGKWSTVTRTKVSAKLTFALAVKATQAGKQAYRVYAPSTTTTKATASKAFGYTVWSWYNLGGTYVDNYASWDGDFSIGGKTFRDSLIISGLYDDPIDGWADYNVNYKCTTFRATIGMRDDSVTGAVRSFGLGIDSTTVNFGTRGLGAGLAVTADITDAYRIRLSSTPDGNKIDGRPVFGTPQVYCSTAP